MNESNFQHILRVLNTNLDGRVKVMFALTSIKGVGRRFSNIACKKAEVDLNKRCADRPLRLAGRRESRRDRDACLSRLKSPDGCRTPPRRARGLQATATDGRILLNMCCPCPCVVWFAQGGRADG